MQFIDLACIAVLAALVAGGTARAQTDTPASNAAASTAPATSTLSVTFTGIEAKRGNIMLALYDEASWSSGKPVRSEILDAATGTASVVISGLPVGRYGIKAFHDINGNSRMDSNPFGMPTEPFAFSNNAKGSVGPAAWEDAAFAVGAGETAQTITIR